ncbi:PP2C family protein-serine/threonine phosphatase [Streptomyces sp. V4-01]|uniref:PP2C family protein-serine/threonine phosphatase n=1 Tax=Actinacidiphila polyblastidii TaxID=3110430 RepID=A0ABU7P3Q1_9ACTN|nr:PP2C family protein-serine/threonine phosphatase [Streptomyces sp. V4-01]
MEARGDDEGDGQGAVDRRGAPIPRRQAAGPPSRENRPWQEAHLLRARVRELERRCAALEAAEQQTAALNAGLLVELEETNRGVVALYQHEHQLALTLQRTFLPAVLPSVAHMSLAVRYLAADPGNEIGGDFYEAVSTPEGLLLAVGDVAGHNLQAAVMMGELRHALRAYAYDGHSPRAIVSRLDRLLRLTRPGRTATVCVALVDLTTGTLRFANAGHLPPLLAFAGAAPHYVHEHGPLLGLGLPQPPETTVHLTPGARLLMVTDGLIEAPGTHLDDSLEQLRSVVANAPADGEAFCDALLDAFRHHRQDDVVVFSAEFTGG